MFPIRSWIENLGNFAYFDRGTYGTVLPTGEAVFNWDAYDMCTHIKDKNGNLLWENDIIFVEYPFTSTKFRQTYVDIDTQEIEKKGYYGIIKYSKPSGRFVLVNQDTQPIEYLSAYVAKHSELVGNIYRRQQ